MNIREATREDFDQIWPIFHEIAAAGETYAYPRDITREQALKLWIDGPRKTYVFEGTERFLARRELRAKEPASKALAADSPSAGLFGKLRGRAA